MTDRKGEVMDLKVMGSKAGRRMERSSAGRRGLGMNTSEFRTADTYARSPFWLWELPKLRGYFASPNLFTRV